MVEREEGKAGPGLIPGPPSLGSCACVCECCMFQYPFRRILIFSYVIGQGVMWIN